MNVADEEVAQIDKETSAHIVIKKFKQMYQKYKGALSSLDSTLSHTKLLSSSLQSSRDETKQANQVNKQLQSGFAELQSTIDSLKQDRIDLKKAQAKLEKQIQALENDNKAFVEREGEWSRILQEERQKTQAAMASIEELMLREEEWSQEWVLREEQFEEKHQQLKEVIKQQQNVASDLATYEKKDSQQSKLIEDLQSKVEDLDAFKQSAEEEIETLVQQREFMIDEVEKQAEADEQYLDKLRSDLADAETIRLNEIKSLEDKLSVEKLKSLRIEKYVEKIKDDVKQLENDYERIVAENEMLALQAEEGRMATDELQEVRLQKILVEEENGEYQKALEVSQRDLERTVKDLERVKEDREQLRRETDRVVHDNTGS